MLKTVIVALSGALIAAATPALADGAKTAADAPAEVSTAARPAPNASKAVKPTRYCIEELVTGSRLPHRTCRTREDWLRDGFDPLAK